MDNTRSKRRFILLGERCHRRYSKRRDELIGFAKITRDITERKKAEERLNLMQKKLAESQKLDALGQLTGGVAHDFNNLLMIIAGNIHTVRKEVATTKGLRALQSIETAAQRAASLTRQLLTFARRQSVQPQSIDLPIRLESLRDVLSSGLGSNIDLRIDVEPGVWNVVVDPSELETALVNLAVNARDAMPDGGLVSVTAKNNVVSGHVEISFDDSGLGIPDDIAAKVFDPFFTTKPVGKGTGLGLSQVHGFAHQAGGTVGLRSNLGMGTTITICLPRATVDVARNAEAQPCSGSGAVLLVEDNPEVASATMGLLEELGYNVRWVSDATSALSELNDDIDVLVSDIIMPGGMDGVDLAKTVRSLRPKLPILLMTGYSSATMEGTFRSFESPTSFMNLATSFKRLPPANQTGAALQVKLDEITGQCDT